jgi:hypothetical protein
MKEKNIFKINQTEIDLTKLCYYDKRNPDFQIKEEYGYDKEEVEATGNFSKKDCACDNCFYGRSKLTEQLIWQTERMYSEEDLRNAFDSAREFDSLDGIVDVHIVLPMGGDMSDLQPLHFTFDEWFEQFKKNKPR